MRTIQRETSEQVRRRMALLDGPRLAAPGLVAARDGSEGGASRAGLVAVLPSVAAEPGPSRVRPALGASRAPVPEPAAAGPPGGGLRRSPNRAAPDPVSGACGAACAMREQSRAPGPAPARTSWSDKLDGEVLRGGAPGGGMPGGDVHGSDAHGSDAHGSDAHGADVHGAAASGPPHPEPPGPEHPRPSGRGRLPQLRLALRERIDVNRRALAGLGVLLLLGSGYAVQRFWLSRPEPVAIPAAAAGASGAAAPGRDAADPAAEAPGAASYGAGTGDASASPVIDVAGRVRRPGLVRLRPGARVQDALLAAGGELPGTDVTGLNLARRVVDGEQIVVGATPPAAAAPGAPAQAPVSLSAATEVQLEALPGIGPTLAQRIIRYRTQHGGFRSVDELLRVSGFGRRRLSDLRDVLRP